MSAAGFMNLVLDSDVDSEEGREREGREGEGREREGREGGGGIQRTTSFRTKLKRGHSDQCMKKGELMLTEKNVVEHKFSIYKEDVLLMDMLKNSIIRLEKIHDKIQQDYNIVMLTGSPTGVIERLIWDGSLTGGLDFSRGTKIKLYEKALIEVRERINTYKGIIECLGLENAVNKFINCSSEVEKLKVCTSPDSKGKLHSKCKCPNIIMSRCGEYCDICMEESVRLFDIRCGNGHMLCYVCIDKMFSDFGSGRGEGGFVCPFCRLDVNITPSILAQIKKFSGDAFGL